MTLDTTICLHRVHLPEDTSGFTFIRDTVSNYQEKPRQGESAMQRDTGRMIQSTFDTHLDNLAPSRRIIELQHASLCHRKVSLAIQHNHGICNHTISLRRHHSTHKKYES